MLLFLRSNSPVSGSSRSNPFEPGSLHGLNFGEFQEVIEVLELLKNKNVFEGVYIRTAEGQIQSIKAKEAIFFVVTDHEQ